MQIVQASMMILDSEVPGTRDAAYGRLGGSAWRGEAFSSCCAFPLSPFVCSSCSRGLPKCSIGM